MKGITMWLSAILDNVILGGNCRRQGVRGVILWGLVRVRAATGL